MKILIVEDNRVNLKLASELLLAAGHVITMALTADVAILSIKMSRPDAIILDLHLAGDSGLSVARHCRKDAGTRDIPIIAVTAFANNFDQNQIIESGCDGFIAKPINTRTFAQEIAKIVAAKAKSRE